MFMDFELNHDEFLQLEALQQDLSRVLSTINALGSEHYEHTHSFDDFSLIQAKISLIRSKARKRSLAYFASRPEELISALKGEISNSVIELVTLEKSSLFSMSAPEITNPWKNNITYSLSPYLPLLNDSERADIMNFIEEAFNNREQIFRDEQEKQSPTYEAATAKRVRKIIAPVDKVTQSIFTPSKTPDFYGNRVDLLVSPKDKKKNVTTGVAMHIEDIDGIKGVGMVTPYDKAVYNAVISHILAGNIIFSDSMISRAMTGKNNVEEKSRLAIRKAMDRLTCTRIFIDMTQEAEAFHIQDIEPTNPTQEEKSIETNANQVPNKRVMLKGHLLEARTLTATINGQTGECYKILAEPLLLTYAKAKKQLNTYNISILNAPFQAISATPENIVIVNSLLDRIMAMRNPKNKMKNIILYQTLYKLLGLDAPTDSTLRAKKRDIREKVHKILDMWTKEGLIAGFEDLDEDGNTPKPRKEITKVRILF